MACMLSSFVAGCGNEPEGVVDVTSEDAEMNEAIAMARDSLPHFWSTYDNPKGGESDFTLKVILKDAAGNVEHIWVGSIQKENGKIFGEIDNEPVQVKEVKYGQVIEINENDISDWTYIKEGKIYGGYTIRVLIERIPTDQAEELKQQLSDKPF